MSKWTVVVYDVWGNAEDGWEVNAKYRTWHWLEIEDDAQDHEVLSLLCAEMGGDPDTLEFDNSTYSEDVQYVQDARDGKPVCELVRE